MYMPLFKTTEWVGLEIRFILWRCWIRILARTLAVLIFFVVIVDPSGKMFGYWLDYARTFPVHQLTCQPTVYSLDIGSIIK
jgi:hypothetical protein